MSELFREGLRRMEQEAEARPTPAALAQLGDLVRLIQQEAKQAGLDKMSKAEINAEVEGARKEMRKKPATRRSK